MMGIIDYGLGNIYAISNIYNKLKVKNMIIKNVEDFDRADKFILPGVGAFDSAINLLDNSNLVSEIKEQVFKKKKRFWEFVLECKFLLKQALRAKNLDLNG